MQTETSNQISWFKPIQSQWFLDQNHACSTTSEFQQNHEETPVDIPTLVRSKVTAVKPLMDNLNAIPCTSAASLPFLSMDAPALLHCLSVDLGGFLGWLEDYCMKSSAIWGLK
ncbi:hypothetical protein OIU84_010404 [Salix udensis]|uniref:Uncharacterized protein n=1 Tax=Salix udensis TaxID=889485 RepID=A0AAD6JM19_9ROSI|nr:hypothetical protein OIU84_010404 [Salix udensis]